MQGSSEVTAHELTAVARELGEALNRLPAVQDYLRACQAAEQDEEARWLEAEVERVYRQLVARQQAGETLAPRDVNEFYKLRDRLVNHPLIVRREEALAAVKALFEQVGGAISSILSVDYTQMVL